MPVGFVLATLVKINNDIGAVSVPADIHSLGISLAGIGKGKHIRHAGRGQHPFKLILEQILSCWHCGNHAFLLLEEKLVI